MGFNFIQLFSQPYVALFIAVGLGSILGELIKIKGSSLGAVAGALIMAILIGLIHKYILPEEEKNIFFALFIFSLGYSGGQVLLSSLTKKMPLC